MSKFHQVLEGIDVAPLLAQIAEHPELWDYDDSWTRDKPEATTVVYGVDVIVLRYNSRSSPGQAQRWNRPAADILTTALPIVLDVARAIPGEHIGKILITRMQPGDEIKPHTHLMPVAFHGGPRLPHYYRRYQIPLQVEKGCVFRCGGEELYMPPGTAWSFEDIDPDIAHSVFNGSNSERISMLADIRPLQ